MIAATPVAKPVSYGTIVVTEFMGQSKVPGTLTGPAEGGVPISGANFEEAVQAARQLKTMDDPGTQAVIDSGDGALLLRPVTMSPEAANLFGSRSYGGAVISDAPKGMLGIFDWAHEVPATPAV